MYKEQDDQTKLKMMTDLVGQAVDLNALNSLPPQIAPQNVNIPNVSRWLNNGIR